MYLTAQELHIAIDVGLQNIDSNRRLDIRPEEKDLVLNTCLLQFIETRSSSKTNIKREGFEDSVKRYDDIKELKRMVTNLPVYKYDDETVYCILPEDYLKHVRSRSSVIYSCLGIDYTSYTNEELYVVQVPFLDDVVVGYKYVNFVLKVGGVTVVSGSTNFNNLINTKSKFMLINYVLDTCNNGSNNFTVYWERYFETYVKDNFLIVVNGITTTAQLTYTGYDSGVINPTGQTVQRAVISTTGVTKKNELVSSEIIDDAKDNYYYTKNRHNKPFTTLYRNTLQIHHNDLFKIKTIDLEYIRRPKLININLNTGCEISKGEEIVALAVQKLMATVGSEQYKYVAQENLTIE